jgi:hypothetical protein
MSIRSRRRSSLHDYSLTGLGLLWLIPLSTIFQLYRGGGRSRSIRGKPHHRPPQVPDKLYHRMLYRVHLAWSGYEITTLVYSLTYNYLQIAIYDNIKLPLIYSCLSYSSLIPTGYKFWNKEGRYGNNRMIVVFSSTYSITDYYH